MRSYKKMKGQKFLCGETSRVEFRAYLFVIMHSRKRALNILQSGAFVMECSGNYNRRWRPCPWQSKVKLYPGRPGHRKWTDRFWCLRKKVHGEIMKRLSRTVLRFTRSLRGRFLRSSLESAFKEIFFSLFHPRRGGRKFPGQVGMSTHQISWMFISSGSMTAHDPCKKFLHNFHAFRRMLGRLGWTTVPSFPFTAISSGLNTRYSRVQLQPPPESQSSTSIGPLLVLCTQKIDLIFVLSANRTHKFAFLRFFTRLLSSNVVTHFHISLLNFYLEC